MAVKDGRVKSLEDEMTPEQELDQVVSEMAHTGHLPREKLKVDTLRLWLKRCRVSMREFIFAFRLFDESYLSELSALITALV